MIYLRLPQLPLDNFVRRCDLIYQKNYINHNFNLNS